MARNKKENSTDYKTKAERKVALKEIMKGINKKHGETLVKLASEEPSKERLSFGVKEIDELTGGGSICGNFTVVYGGKDVGKTTLCYHHVAQAQREGKICAWIDLEHSFSVERATQFGMNLEDLIFVGNADNAEEAMDVIMKLSKGKVVDLIVVDSIQAMSPEGEQQTKTGGEKSIKDDTMALLARKLGQFFRMCATPIYKGNVAVVLIGQVRTKGIGSFYTYDGLSGGNALEHWMKLCLFMRIGQKADAPTEKQVEIFQDPDGKDHKKTNKVIVGHDAVIKVEKCQVANCKPQGTDVHIPFYWKDGFIKQQEEPKKPDIRILHEGEVPKKKKRGRPKKNA